MYSNYQPQPIQIQHEVVQILKTMMQLSKPASGGYLIRILQADTTYPLREAEHKDLDTYGSLEDQRFGFLDNVIRYLIRNAWISVANFTYGTLSLTDAGKAYLDDPQPIHVSRDEFYRAWHEIELKQKLRDLRREFAQKEALQPYQLFNNFNLDQIIQRMPGTEAELADIPGVDLDPEQIAPVLEAIDEIRKKKVLDEETGVFRKAYSTSYRKVKELYEAGYELAEIAQRRRIAPRTAQNYLIVLHQAGNIDLRPWIEANVDQKDLHKACEYFRQAANPELKEAHEVLGLDYEILNLAKAYDTDPLYPPVKPQAV